MSYCEDPNCKECRPIRLPEKVVPDLSKRPADDYYIREDGAKVVRGGLPKRVSRSKYQ